MSPDVPAARPIPRAPARVGPALFPMLWHQPMLLPVLDTNALLTEACYLVAHGRQNDKITALAGTGRSNPFLAPHVLEEIDEHLPKLAAYYQVPEQQVRDLLARRILPAARVVDLEIRDHLAPQTRHILRVDHKLDLRHRGDPDDAPTMALAEFLGPCVIVSADSVFARFGFAVIDAIPVVQKLLRMAGLEATASDAVAGIDTLGRLLGVGVAALYRLAARYPLQSGLVLGAALLFLHRRGYLRLDEVRRRAGQLWELARPELERGAAALEEQRSLRDSLLVVEPTAFPNLEQTAARYLARRGRPMTPADLRDDLAARGHHASAAALKRAMTGHSAFVRAPGDLWTVGRPAGLAP